MKEIGERAFALRQRIQKQKKKPWLNQGGDWLLDVSAARHQKTDGIGAKKFI